MSQIDEELAKAANASEPDAPPVVAGAPQGSPRKKGNIGLLAVLLVMVVGIAGLVLSFKEAAVYAKTVDQVLAEKDKLAGRAVRVEGDLVKGSLVHQEQPCEYRFKMSAGEAQIPVRYANCVVPDTFRDVPGMDVKVTVEGKMSSEGTFEASLVMAKCPSKYEMKQRAEKGETMPHDAMTPLASIAVRIRSRRQRRQAAPTLAPLANRRSRCGVFSLDRNARRRRRIGGHGSLRFLIICINALPVSVMLMDIGMTMRNVPTQL